MHSQTAYTQRHHRSVSRVPQSAPAPVPADARAELQHFFKSYDAACFDFDADAVASLYDLPCLISSAEGNGSFTARGELRAAFARIFTGYRQRGLVTASLAALDLTALSDDFAQGQAIWSLSNGRGQEVTSFARHYTLRRAFNGSLGRWRIVHAVALEEAEKLARRQGPRAPILTLR
jgi:ketosteroid isomerase-like protein